MKKSEKRRATLKQKVLTELFGGIKNVPKVSRDVNVCLLMNVMAHLTATSILGVLYT